MKKLFNKFLRILARFYHPINILQITSIWIIRIFRKYTLNDGLSADYKKVQQCHFRNVKDLCVTQRHTFKMCKYTNKTVTAFKRLASFNFRRSLIPTIFKLKSNYSHYVAVCVTCFANTNGCVIIVSLVYFIGWRQSIYWKKKKLESRALIRSIFIGHYISHVIRWGSLNMTYDAAQSERWLVNFSILHGNYSSNKSAKL